MLINSRSIILQKYLMKSSYLYIYIYMYMYIYCQNYENRTMHFYCMITYNLLHLFSLQQTKCKVILGLITYKVTTLLHIFLNVTKSREQMHSSVGVDMKQMTTDSKRERVVNTCGRSYDQPSTYAGNTLSKIIL